MKVYKVLWTEAEGKLVSAIAVGSAQVSYRKDRFAQAPAFLRKEGYHLFAFRRLKDAKNFVVGYKEYKIFRAEAKGVTKRLPQPLCISYLGTGQCIPSFISYPEGTIMCQKIKLLEEVIQNGKTY
ncbi:MAG TPA: hypothetical protein EYP29_02390 [Thermoplasmata archaeon]|nr:hypothetical protein [Thermoplasmata archaeon]